jgi:hypothetical protein
MTTDFPSRRVAGASTGRRRALPAACAQRSNPRLPGVMVRAGRTPYGASGSPRRLTAPGVRPIRERLIDGRMDR